MKRIQVKDKYFKGFISQEDIEEKIQEIADKLNQEYLGKIPCLIIVLNGAFRFAGELIKHLDIALEIAFIRLKSYKGTESSGNIEEVWGLEQSLKGRDVILIEDIIDTGHTMAFLLEKIRAEEPSSIEIVSLLMKPDKLIKDIQIPKYIGFEIPNVFVLGFGLDYDNFGRELNDLYALDT